jgi:hypothetical protein
VGGAVVLVVAVLVLVLVLVAPHAQCDVVPLKK